MILPTQTYILLEICDAQETELHLPVGAQPRCPYGNVLAVGPDCKFTSVGDHVMFLSHVPVQFEKQGPQGQDVFIISEGSVIAKLSPDHNPSATIHVIN